MTTVYCSAILHLPISLTGGYASGHCFPCFGRKVDHGRAADSYAAVGRTWGDRQTDVVVRQPLKPEVVPSRTRMRFTPFTTTNRPNIRVIAPRTDSCVHPRCNIAL